jgi:hypothetical protein
MGDGMLPKGVDHRLRIFGSKPKAFEKSSLVAAVFVDLT